MIYTQFLQRSRAFFKATGSGLWRLCDAFDVEEKEVVFRYFVKAEQPQITLRIGFISGDRARLSVHETKA